MPAFVKVLERLVLEGNEVDIIFYDLNIKNLHREYFIENKWFKKIRILDHFFYKERKGILKLLSQLIIYIKISIAVNKALKNNKYDFIYGHNHLAEAANHSAKKIKFPLECGAMEIITGL